MLIIVLCLSDSMSKRSVIIVAARTPVLRSILSCDDLRSGAQASGYTQAMELCVETLFQCLPLEKLLMSQ